MRILALEAWGGESRSAFLRGVAAHSRHEWTVFEQPAGDAGDWRWRVRLAPMEFLKLAGELERLPDQVFCADSLNVAEWRGAAAPAIARLPHALYQSTLRLPDPYTPTGPGFQDSACTALWNAASSDLVCFNSDYHRREYLRRAEAFLKQYPLQGRELLLERVKRRARVVYPGLDANSLRGELPADVAARKTLPLVLWLHPWEEAYSPDLFFDALAAVRDGGVRFQVAILGKGGDDAPAVFGSAHAEFGDDLLHFGRVESREEYAGWLRLADIAVSTAKEETFDIALAEAALCGCAPLAPNRLAYPEMFDPGRFEWALFHNKDDLIDKLRRLINARDRAPLHCEADLQRFLWPQAVERFDEVFQK